MYSILKCPLTAHQQRHWTAYVSAARLARPHVSSQPVKLRLSFGLHLSFGVHLILGHQTHRPGIFAIARNQHPVEVVMVTLGAEAVSVNGWTNACLRAHGGLHFAKLLEGRVDDRRWRRLLLGAILETFLHPIQQFLTASACLLIGFLSVAQRLGRRRHDGAERADVAIEQGIPALHMEQ